MATTSQRQQLSKGDQINERTFNEATWKSAKGAVGAGRRHLEADRRGGGAVWARPGVRGEPGRRGRTTGRNEGENAEDGGARA